MRKPVENDPLKAKDSLILWFAYHLFDALRQVSLFQQIRNIAKRCFFLRFKRRHAGATNEAADIAWRSSQPFVTSYTFSDLWVIIHLILGLAACFIVAHSSLMWLRWLFVIYAVLRTFEIFVYQINVLLFDPIKVGRANYRIKSATRMILLLLCNIVEYILWFSVIYLFVFRNSGSEVSAMEMIHESFLIISNNARPEEIPNSFVAAIGYVEFVLGMFMNILCLARFISLLPAVQQVDDY